MTASAIKRLLFAGAAVQILSTSAAIAETGIPQSTFTSIISRSKASYNEGATQIQKTTIRIARKQEICAFNTVTARDWYGRVVDVKSQNDGSAGLVVKAKGFKLMQVPGIISAGNYVKPDSPLYKIYLSLKPGDLVAFHGRFSSGDKDCFKEFSLSESGSMAYPEFVFDFTEVTSYGKMATPSYLDLD